MPQTIPCILWPVRFTATSYVIRLTIGGVTENVTISGLTVGRNYWLSGDAQGDADGGVGGVGDLYELVRVALNTHSGADFTTCDEFDGTGTAKLLVASGTFSILWSSGSTTFDPALLGFTSADNPSPAAASTTSPNRVKGIWNPGRQPTVDGRDRQPVVGGIAVAISGLQRASRLALPKKTRDLTWDVLTQNKSLREYEDATDPTGSAEEMYLSALSLGYPVRYYPDRTDRSSTGYTLYVARDMDEILTRDDQYKVRWRVALRLRAA